MKKIAIALLVLAGAFGILLLWAGSAEQPEAWNPPRSPAPLSRASSDLVLDITPQQGRIDEEVQIRVSGATPGEEVILRAGTVDAGGRDFESWARFQANDQGVVDTAIMQPSEGTYRSADPGGLLWSMRSAAAERYQFPPDTPVTKYNVSAETSRGVTSTKLVRTNPALTLSKEAVHTDRVDAELWLPGGHDEPLPAVLRLHGSEGEFDPVDSALLASAGIAVLDLRYIEPNGLPTIIQIPVERVSWAIDWLVDDSRIDGDRVGVFGGSKGAELALVAASKDPRIRAVVAWSPASVVFEGISFREVSPGSSWSWQGDPTPYAPYRGTRSGALRHTTRILFRKVSFLPVYSSALERAPEEAAIPVERIEGAILLMAGTDDRMWPAARMVEAMEKRLTARGHSRHEIVLFEDAGHRMRYALWPDLHTPSRIVGGGTPEANHAAGRLAWRRIKDFFQHEL